MTTAIDPRIGRGVRASEKLVEQIIALADGHGAVIVHSERAWASATFQGTRHRLMIAYAGNAAFAAGSAMIDALPEHEFNIPGQIVADAQTVRTEKKLDEVLMVTEIALLLLEDD